jgi:hypothetical protein
LFRTRVFVDTSFTKSHYYSLEPTFIYLKEEQTYATARGPGFAESYDRYDASPSGTFKTAKMAIIVPRNVAPGKLEFVPYFPSKHLSGRKQENAENINTRFCCVSENPASMIGVAQRIQHSRSARTG